MWNKTKLTQLLNIKYPIIQGPFGGGLSSVSLTATVSNMGGLGSFGAQPFTSEEIIGIVANIKKQTHLPFAINLWVSYQTELANEYTPTMLKEVNKLFEAYFNEAGIQLPTKVENVLPKYEDQIEGLFKAQPPVFSFVYGIPSKEVIKECKKNNIITIGTATTLDEALTIQEAGIDGIVVTGMEAGGHRVSFLRSPEESLTGLFSLLQQSVKHIQIPIIAAGGIVDGLGLSTVLKLGASAAQIGTAFLACEESNAAQLHKDILFTERAKHTVLTKAFTGRLARGTTSKIAIETKANEHLLLPYPLQSNYMGDLRRVWIEKGKDDYITFWAGQSASLLKHRSAKILMNALINDTNTLMK